MPSDFKNIFIQADNESSKYLNDNDQDPTKDYSLSSRIDEHIKSKQENRLKPSKISVNPNQSLSAQLDEYSRKKAELKGNIQASSYKTREVRIAKKSDGTYQTAIVSYDDSFCHYSELTASDKCSIVAKFSLVRMIEHIATSQVGTISACRQYKDTFYELPADEQQKIDNAKPNNKKYFALKESLSMDNSTNLARTKRLEQSLNQNRSKIGYVKILGHFKESGTGEVKDEYSFFVYSLDHNFPLKKYLCRVGKVFHQDAITVSIPYSNSTIKDLKKYDNGAKFNPNSSLPKFNSDTQLVEWVENSKLQVENSIANLYLQQLDNMIKNAKFELVCCTEKPFIWDNGRKVKYGQTYVTFSGINFDKAMADPNKEKFLDCFSELWRRARKGRKVNGTPIDDGKETPGYYDTQDKNHRAFAWSNYEAVEAVITSYRVAAKLLDKNAVSKNGTTLTANAKLFFEQRAYFDMGSCFNINSILKHRVKSDSFLKTFKELTEAEKMNITALSMSRLYQRMRDCPIAVISGCRGIDDKSLIKDYGMKEACKILVDAENPKSSNYIETKEILSEYSLSKQDNEQRTKALQNALKVYSKNIGYKIVKESYREAGEEKAKIAFSFICFEIKPFSNKTEFKNILLNLGREFDQDSIIINTPNKSDIVFTEICTTPYSYLIKNDEKVKFGDPIAELKDPKFRNTIADEKLEDGSDNPDFLVAFTEFIRKIKNKGKVSRFGFGSYKALSQSNITAKSIRAKLENNLKEGVVLVKGNNHTSKWMTAKCLYDSTTAFKMDSILGAEMRTTRIKATEIDTNSGYCFIDERDLVMQLENVSAELSNNITTAIQQVENLSLIYALIKDVRYNSLNKHYSFIFDIDNPLSDQSLNQLVVEVPLSALKNVKLNQIKNVLTAQIYNGTYQFRGDDCL
ncbi:hypothetical protein [Helicobacter cetorum]|uniref:hypothetical protein n=1 Tax=Helicobacter cetorum TaxID=138563 RepID=UPI001F2391BA|nr:hypothetical protein [Helicobacter cetorum]